MSSACSRVSYQSVSTPWPSVPQSHRAIERSRWCHRRPATDRRALRHADAAGRLTVGPVDALSLVVMAVLHEAATAIADGDDPGAMHSVIIGMIGAITRP